jgi:hypothetical protein
MMGLRSETESFGTTRTLGDEYSVSGESELNYGEPALRRVNSSGSEKVAL